jgi:hypothetical protein
MFPNAIADVFSVSVVGGSVSMAIVGGTVSTGADPQPQRIKITHRSKQISFFISTSPYQVSKPTPG